MTMKKLSVVVLIAAFAFIRCGSGVTYSTASGIVNILNGPTAAAGLSKSAALGKAASALVSNGTYALSPSKMTLTVTGLGFLPPDVGANQVHIFAITPCIATYDRSLGSLSVLNSGDITVPVGTFGSLTIEYNTTYTVVMDDTVAGIYSDPDAPGHLTTTRPAGGGRPIQVRDQNNPGDKEHATFYFSSPATFGEGSVPQIYVVFDPTHWVKADYNNGQFSLPHMGGNPPIIPSMSSFGKATYYSNIGTAMSYLWGGRALDSSMSLLFLYADTATPVSVTWQDGSICQSGINAMVVAFNGNGTLFGTYGMLGLDADKVLAWASPVNTGGNNAVFSGYSGVYKMQELSILGQTTVVSYSCTSNVPQPVSGPNYSSGAPNFTPSGTLTLTLLEN
jgi:hypothetical protein